MILHDKESRYGRCYQCFTKIKLKICTPPKFFLTASRSYLRCEVEVEERDEVPLEQPGEEAQVYAVGELRVQIVYLEVDLVQMLVDECYKRFLHHL